MTCVTSSGGRGGAVTWLDPANCERSVSDGKLLLQLLGPTSLLKSVSHSVNHNQDQSNYLTLCLHWSSIGRWHLFVLHWSTLGCSFKVRYCGLKKIRLFAHSVVYSVVMGTNHAIWHRMQSRAGHKAISCTLPLRSLSDSASSLCSLGRLDSEELLGCDDFRLPFLVPFLLLLEDCLPLVLGLLSAITQSLPMLLMIWVLSCWINTSAML